MATEQQLESFHRFASEQLQQGAQELSIGDLVDLWELRNLPAEQVTENVAAIQASLNDMLAGATGRAAADVLRELRQQELEDKRRSPPLEESWSRQIQSRSIVHNATPVATSVCQASIITRSIVPPATRSYWSSHALH